MPTPLKPCDGKLSEATQEMLRSSRSRAGWETHSCDTCGQTVGVVLTGNMWAPERHWPSVSYPPRKSSGAPRLGRQY